MAISVPWARSFVVRDEIDFYRGNVLHQIVSEHGVISWARFDPQPHGYHNHVATIWRAAKLQESQERDDFWNWWEIGYRWKWGDFDAGAGTSRAKYWETVVRWAIPYWPVAIPLTLLSAYLILSPAKQKVLE